MTSRTALVSGAGIAGATVGYWLARRGFKVIVVERAMAQRSSGNPVDIRGAALAVVREMGLMAELRAAATTATRTVVVDAKGTEIGTLATQNAARLAGGSADIEIARAELARALVSSAASTVDLRWGDSIAEMTDGPKAVEVTLTSGLQLSVDLVIGADGVYSHTRNLAFGPAAARRTHLGLYVGTTRVEGLEAPPDRVQIHNEPGRMVSLHPGNRSPIIAYLFRHPQLAGFDHRDAAAHRRLILSAFEGGGWRIPEFLQHTRGDDDVFLDAIARVRVPHWSSGRVGLVGDAASCVSLLGNGSSKAITGAYTLAAELSSTTDHELAFRRYQHTHQRSISSATTVRAGARFLVPAHSVGINARNRALRALACGSAAESLAAAGPS